MLRRVSSSAERSGIYAACPFLLRTMQGAVPSVEQEPIGGILKRGLHIDQCVDFIQNTIKILDEYFVTDLTTAHLRSMRTVRAEFLGLLADVGFLNEGNAQLRTVPEADGQLVAKLAPHSPHG